MKMILSVLLLFLLTNSFGQAAKNDTMIIIDPKLYTYTGEYLAHKLRYTYPDQTNFICYYDSSRVNKFFEGTAIPGERKRMNFRMYYLNGKLNASEKYDAINESEEVYLYHINGDPAYMHTLNKGKSISQSWGHNYERKLITTHKQICNSGNCSVSVSFDELTGDTTQTNWMYGFQGRYFTSGMLSGYKKAIADEITRIVIPANKMRNLNLRFNSKERISSTYYPAKDHSIPLRQLDSLIFYKDLRDFTITVDDEELIPQVMEKLKFLPQLPYLRSITLGGNFSEIPPSIFECKQLRSLKLNGTKIDLIPEQISKLQKLNYFQMTYNPAHDYTQSLINLSQLPALFTLKVSYHADSLIPKELKRLKSLKSLALTLYGDTKGCPEIYRYANDKNQQTDSVNLHFLLSMNQLQELVLCEDLVYSPAVLKYQVKFPNIKIQYENMCFVPGTEITMANGDLRRIEEIEIGDEILGYDEQTKKLAPAIVNKVYEHPAISPPVVEITYRTPEGKEKLIAATNEHPFLADGLWIKAEDLTEGQLLQIRKNDATETVVIGKIVHSVSDVETVYNLNTSLHTFFAGGVVVHNK